MQTKEKTTKIKWISYSVMFFALFVSFTLLVALSCRKPLVLGEKQITANSIDLLCFSLITSHTFWFVLTEIIGYLALFIAFCVSIYGVFSWIKTKSIKRINPLVLASLIAFVITVLFYVAFEFIPINYRPILIDGNLEKSYPSSHSLLIVVVSLTLKDILSEKIANKKIRIAINVVLIILILFTLIGRILCARHWVSDVIGGALLGLSIYYAFKAMAETFWNKN